MAAHAACGVHPHIVMSRGISERIPHDSHFLFVVVAFNWPTDFGIFQVDWVWDVYTLSYKPFISSTLLWLRFSAGLVIRLLRYKWFPVGVVVTLEKINSGGGVQVKRFRLSNRLAL